MKRILFFFVFCAFVGGLNEVSLGQKWKVNYDESKVPKYTLPDPLVMSDGTVVKTPEDWMTKRRPELLALFKKEMFGQMPGVDRSKLSFKELTLVPDALQGKATRKEIRVFFDYPNLKPKVDLVLYIPNKRTGPVGAFLGWNFWGNHASFKDTGIAMTEYVDGSKVTREVYEKRRAGRSSRWAVEKVIDRGYALVTGYYEEIDPDDHDGFSNGVHPLFAKEFPDKQAGDYPATITAWAWGLSRALDCLETLPEIDAKKVVVMGHSRLGKTSLWAGANDTRFAAVISNNSGCGGSALSRREFGETLHVINTAFPHWFCNNFKKYIDKADTLPFDQHELIALVAPRPVYIASAQEDRWADPKGEFLSALGADKVYRLLKTGGFGGVKDFPPELNKSVGDVIRYHIRTGKHDVTQFDWDQYLDFADKYVK